MPRTSVGTRGTASLRGLAAFKRDATSLPHDLEEILNDMEKLAEQMQTAEESGRKEVHVYAAELCPPARGKKRPAPQLDEIVHKDKWQRIEEFYSTATAAAQQKLQLADKLYNIVDALMQRLNAEYAALEADILSRREELTVPSGSTAVQELAMLSPTQLTKVKPSLRKRVLKTASQPQVLPGMALEHAGDGAEVLYCVCQRPSCGDMVACDNDDCKIGWFHYECMGLTPGQDLCGTQWLCDDCKNSGFVRQT